MRQAACGRRQAACGRRHGSRASVRGMGQSESVRYLNVSRYTLDSNANELNLHICTGSLGQKQQQQKQQQTKNKTKLN